MISSVINGGWQTIKILPYKHAIAAYGATIAGLPSQIALWWLAKVPPRHGVHGTTI